MKSHAKIFIITTLATRTNSVKLSNLIMNKVNGYIKESNGNKCSTLVSADESREALKKYEEI